MNCVIENSSSQANPPSTPFVAPGGARNQNTFSALCGAQIDSSTSGQENDAAQSTASGASQLPSKADLLKQASPAGSKVRALSSAGTTQQPVSTVQLAPINLALTFPVFTEMQNNPPHLDVQDGLAKVEAENLGAGTPAQLSSDPQTGSLAPPLAGTLLSVEPSASPLCVPAKNSASPTAPETVPSARPSASNSYFSNQAPQLITQENADLIPTQTLSPPDQATTAPTADIQDFSKEDSGQAIDVDYRPEQKPLEPITASAPASTTLAPAPQDTSDSTGTSEPNRVSPSPQADACSALPMSNRVTAEEVTVHVAQGESANLDTQQLTSHTQDECQDLPPAKSSPAQIQQNPRGQGILSSGQAHQASKQSKTALPVPEDISVSPSNPASTASTGSHFNVRPFVSVNSDGTVAQDANPDPRNVSTAPFCPSDINLPLTMSSFIPAADPPVQQAAPETSGVVSPSAGPTEDASPKSPVVPSEPAHKNAPSAPTSGTDIQMPSPQPGLISMADSAVSAPAQRSAATPTSNAGEANSSPSSSSPRRSAELPQSSSSPLTSPGTGPIQAARIVTQGVQSEMRIGLNTSAFGSVEVRTVVHANDVGIVIGSEKGDLRSLLANELPAIANTLQQQDLKLNQVNFHQGFAFSNPMSSGGESQPRSYGSRNYTLPVAVSENHSAETAVADEPDSLRFGGGISILA